MRLFHHSSEGPPCAHMVAFLQAAGDGTARGLVRWYAWAHAIRCQRCRRFLESIQKMIEALRGRREQEPGPETRQRLEAMLAALP